jgi:uncharacterized protein DUF5343
MPEAKTKTALPPYVSYKAFKRFIGSMRESHVPSRVDRGVLSGMSGSGQSTMLNSLETLGLIEKDGRPTKKLEQLVTAAPESEKYKALLNGLLVDTYPYLMGDGFGGSLNLKTTTTNEMQGVIRAQGVSGSTVAKVIGFFLSAAKDAGIEVSKYVKTPAISELGVKKRGNTTRNGITGEDDEDDRVEEISLGTGVELHSALTGVLQTLPAPGQPMSDKARARFLKAFEAVLMLAHPSSDEVGPPEEHAST